VNQKTSDGLMVILNADVDGCISYKYPSRGDYIFPLGAGNICVRNLTKRGVRTMTTKELLDKLTELIDIYEEERNNDITALSFKDIDGKLYVWNGERMVSLD